jgi:hypothetical protein
MEKLARLLVRHAKNVILMGAIDGDIEHDSKTVRRFDLDGIARL